MKIFCNLLQRRKYFFDAFFTVRPCNRSLMISLCQASGLGAACRAIASAGGLPSLPIGMAAGRPDRTIAHILALPKQPNAPGWRFRRKDFYLSDYSIKSNDCPQLGATKSAKHTGQAVPAE
jgi:hypothetical protein